MGNHFHNFIRPHLTSDFIEIISELRTGFEKESLRVINSKISKSLHPNSLGSALCNEYITTDFSEAQLELITPPLEGSNSSLDFLDDIHHFVTLNLGEECLWPLSMPPIVDSEDDIRIAKYGNSNLGIFKEVYRNGLSARYGRLMQAISGFHFNISLPQRLWKLVDYKNKNDLKSIKSETYFALLRNVFRMNWLIIYLFGASPILSKSFLKNEDDSFKKLSKDAFHLPYATSLRMSEYGYSNKQRNKTFVSHNSLDEYVKNLRLATNTNNKQFRVFGDSSRQLNSNILQIEDEYYASARVKSNAYDFKRNSSNLLETGVDFIEIRSLDLNPFNRIGIDKETALFLEIFFIYCLVKDSDFIHTDEIVSINSNDLNVAKFGRKPGLRLIESNKEVSLKNWGLKIIDEMLPIAEQLDTKNKEYKKVINSIKTRILEPNYTLSGLLEEGIRTSGLSYMEFGNSIAEKNKNYYLNEPTSLNKEWKSLEYTAKKSLEKQKSLERETVESGVSFEEYKMSIFEN